MSEDVDMSDDPRQLSLIHRRLVSSSAEIMGAPPEEITYQHTVLCQVCLPYRDPGDAVRKWEREQGRIALRINAGEVHDPDTQEWIELGLPFGPKPRLVLMHLNAQAIKTQSPVIEVEDSLTAFVKRIGLAAHGRDIRTIKDQLARLASATIRMAVGHEDRPAQLNGQIVDAFDLWFPKDHRQRVLWPSTVELNGKYFESLAKHAVPLDERAIAALSHSSMALDIYAWLAQRLHRIKFGKSHFVPWKSLKDQFGFNHKRMNNFRAVFLKALGQVHSQYRGARIGIDDRGLTLHHSPPPIQGRIATVPALPGK
jgi:replication initiator protein